MLDAVHDTGLAPPVGGALVRIRCADGSWISMLPPVPGGATVTVATATAAQRTVGDADLARSGYRIVGPQPRSGMPDAVELLVSARLMAAEPRWWRALLAVADRAYDLRMGPVQAVLGGHLVAHMDR